MTTHRTLSRYEYLRYQWCRYNGQQGTDKQIACVRTPETQLDRMLAARGIVVPTDPTVFPIAITEGK